MESSSDWNEFAAIADSVLVLHQGSVSLNASDSGRSPIVDAIRRAFAGELGFIYEPFPVPDFLLKDAEQLARRKYATDAWNVEKVAPC